jgi:hypothetical protein
MSGNRLDEHDPRIEAALAELRGMILQHYPEATFQVTEGEDPCGIYLTATVDVEDTDEVVDVFVDRLVNMQVEEGLPVYVIVLEPTWRSIERLRSQGRL